MCILSTLKAYLRNEIDFWIVHGIMITERLHVNLARDLKYSWFNEYSKKLNILVIFAFYYKYLKYIEIIYNFGNKTVLYLICNCIFWSVKRKNGTASVNTDSQ